MQGKTDTQTPYKMNHPSTLYGYRQKNFLPCFFYLSQNGVSLLSSLTPFCLNKRAKSMDCSIITITFFTIYIFSITITYMVALNHSPFSIDAYICHWFVKLTQIEIKERDRGWPKYIEMVFRYSHSCLHILQGPRCLICSVCDPQMASWRKHSLT